MPIRATRLLLEAPPSTACSILDLGLVSLGLVRAGSGLGGRGRWRRCGRWGGGSYWSPQCLQPSGTPRCWRIAWPSVLVLAVIEVALIVSVMLAGGETLVLPNRPDHYRPVWLYTLCWVTALAGRSAAARSCAFSRLAMRAPCQISRSFD
jgi:hypothetical protein